MSEKSITVTAPAKINLSLRVIGKRSDGYHEVDTLMTPVPGLFDTLTFTEADDYVLTCDIPDVPVDETNLVTKATRLFEKISKISCVASIHLEKRIPHGAGLGGGSSDAAATLRAWNEWHGEPLDEKKLHQAAAELGSDVPFFLKAITARASGRGEILAAADSPPRQSIVIFKPSFSVSTPDAYARWKDAVALPGVSYEAVEFPWGSLQNDLEKPVFGKFLFLAELKNWLNSRPEVRTALMSGSGSAMFALLADASQAEGLIQTVRDRLDPVIWAWSGEIGS
ncbi:MAG: 4-(cytidine 5-diphospho)-2-C-methyl-D-erythritol kinase [Verrucomicrobiota bacterium]|jgi:4-diphosphocytidyl-2-C-methyl-D-erythritol kinase